MEAPGEKHARPLLPRQIAPEQLYELLQTKPPDIEWKSDIECWLLDESARRTRRICGRRRKIGLPTFVPTGIPNPWLVSNPYDAYRCRANAGSGTDHEGLGPCRDHNNAFITMTIQDKFLLGGENAPDGAIPEGSVVGTGVDLDKYIEKAKSEITQDELFSVTRDLWEIEGLKQIVKQQMKDNGASDADIDGYLKLIYQKSQVQVAIAKRDGIMLQTSTVAAMVELFTAGILHIVREVVGNDAASRCLDRFEKEVIIPTEQYGQSEMLLRFRAAGYISESAVEADFIESTIQEPDGDDET